MHRMLAIPLFLLAAACGPNRTNQAHVSAAEAFTRRFSESRLSEWKVRAAAAGKDCSVLLIQTSIIMEDSLVEALHYGSGAYSVYDGGVQSFYRHRAFRAAVYKDSTGKIWTYGATTTTEAKSLEHCR